MGQGNAAFSDKEREPLMSQTSTVTLADVQGNYVQFRRQGGESGVFCDPVYLSDGKVQLTNRTDKCTPVLLMTQRDWDVVKAAAHDGAFGNDYALLPRSKVSDSGVNWVIIWKFPWELGHMEGLEPIHNIPLPVGHYPLENDTWWVSEEEPSDRKLPVDEVFATKWRVGDPGDSPSVHYLEAKGECVAMVSSTYFIGGFQGCTRKDECRVSHMLRDLYEEAGVYSFSCFYYHHAIVLYMDMETGERITPKHLASLLQHEKRGPLILDIMQRVALVPRLIRPWAEAYIARFTE